MSTVGERASEADAADGAGDADVKLEVVVIPVADADRAEEFYGRLGWRLDADFPFDNGFRVVQFTPPGSDASVQFGTKMTSAAPGSAQGLYLVVSDIEAARDRLSARGAEVSAVFHPGTPGAQFSPGGASRVSGRLVRRVHRRGAGRHGAAGVSGATWGNRGGAAREGGARQGRRGGSGGHQ